MIYFDSDMSKSTNTVVYFDWKTVIYIYVCGKCRTQFMLPMEKSVTFIGACANEIIPLINRSFVYKAKEGRMLELLLIVGANKHLTNFSLELKKAACLIQSVRYKMLYHNNVVIKERRNVARDVLCRTTL